MTDETFSNIAKKMVADIRSKTPWDTGNLAKKATKSNSLGNGIIEIYVDEKIAPYFKYVNNYPRTNYRAYQSTSTIQGGRIVKNKQLKTISKPNRNYGYFERAFDDALQKLANRVGGVIVSD